MATTTDPGVATDPTDPAEQPTPKQLLLTHIQEMHATKLPRKRMTLAELQRWHGERHHRWANNHYHAGVNLGPDNRPSGWRTGADAVRLQSGGF